MTDVPPEYEDLVEKLFDDRLSDEELQRLNDALRSSEQAREYFWHLVMLEGYLADLPGWIAGEQYATQLAFSETLEAFVEMESSAEAELQSYPPASTAFQEDQTEQQQVTWHDVRTAGAFCIQSLVRLKATWGVAAAAMICIVALVYATWFAGSPTPSPSQPIARQDQQTPVKTPIPADQAPVAIVLHQSGGDINPSENNMPPGTELTLGQAIALPAGNAMELVYPSGASVILQGPGEFKLLSPDRVGMQHGQITAMVPPEAKGFTIATDQTDFIDHGTEFAVTLDEAGHGEVVVLDGLIEARQARVASQQPLDDQTIMLNEGFGGRLVPDKALPASVEAIDHFQIERYPRNWDDVIYKPALTGEITYAATPPPSLERYEARSANPLLIPERRRVVLTEDLHLNSNKSNRLVIQRLGVQVDPKQEYVIAAGAEINSFLIHFDNLQKVTDGVIERDFKVQFKGRIIGIIETHTYQLETDELFGLASVKYPQEGTLRGAADPPGHPNHDVIRLSQDRRTLTAKMRLTGMDQIRVLVENTDP
jgi:hypothetical protein